MALINKIDNIASVSYNGNTVSSLAAETELLLDPTISKAVDKATAAINEILTYTITITNPALGGMDNVEFSDDIPAGSSYVANSFKVDTVAATPVVTGDNLSYTISRIDSLEEVVIEFQVQVDGGEI